MELNYLGTEQCLTAAQKHDTGTLPHSRLSATVRTADTALEKQSYKLPDLENNPLPQSTDWQLMFQENPEKTQT